MKRSLLSPLLILLVAAGCTALRPAENELRESDIRELEERVLELQQMARMTDSELARLRAKIARVKGTRKEQDVRARISELRAAKHKILQEFGSFQDRCEAEDEIALNSGMDLGYTPDGFPDED